MCGITGFAGLDDEALLHTMCGSLIHRGPDDAGYYRAPGVGLAMRRLAIIDLDTGHQPISNETGDVWVVLNGEIYNYEELRGELAGRGHTLASKSDTETIVHLYEDHGEAFVNRLRGMFAIALWDARRRRLLLARDRIGEKPLYYAVDGGRLYFGSEMKAILQAARSRSVNPQAVCDFLAAGYVARQRTFYRGISKLPPGHLLIWQDGQVALERYWRHDFERVREVPLRQAETELEQTLLDSVRLCLKSDVEVGAFLSGGLDSSIVVAMMREHARKVQTFSVGYSGAAAGFNELHYAERVARNVGTQHHELILEARSSIELLPRILWHYDEPHGEPTSVLVYLLCEFVRQRVKVALSGTGGDEIFFGYPRHAGIRYLSYYRMLPGFVRRQLVERIVARWPESTQGKRFAKRANRFIQGAGLAPERAYLSWVNLFQNDVRAELISSRVREESADPAGEEFLRDHLLGVRGPQSLLGRAAALDLEGYLPEYQLAYMDRMSMAHGLEVRAPLCDYRLVDYVTALPAEHRLKGVRSKHILKRIARRWLPSEIVERKKVGFDSPIGQWFKGELRPFLETFLAPAQVDASGLLDGRAVAKVIDAHLSGARDHSLQLWSILALEAWYRMYIEDGVRDGRDYRLQDMRGAR